jgi:hypothetical protein
MDHPLRRPEDILAYRPRTQILKSGTVWNHRSGGQGSGGRADHGGEEYRFSRGSGEGSDHGRYVRTRLPQAREQAMGFCS